MSRALVIRIIVYFLSRRTRADGVYAQVKPLKSERDAIDNDKGLLQRTARTQNRAEESSSVFNISNGAAAGFDFVLQYSTGEQKPGRANHGYSIVDIWPYARAETDGVLRQLRNSIVLTVHSEEWDRDGHARAEFRQARPMTLREIASHNYHISFRVKRWAGAQEDGAKIALFQILRAGASARTKPVLEIFWQAEESRNPVQSLVVTDADPHMADYCSLRAPCLYFAHDDGRIKRDVYLTRCLPSLEVPMKSFVDIHVLFSGDRIRVEAHSNRRHLGSSEFAVPTRLRSADERYCVSTGVALRYTRKRKNYTTVEFKRMHVSTPNA